MLADVMRSHNAFHGVHHGENIHLYSIANHLMLMRILNILTSKVITHFIDGFILRIKANSITPLPPQHHPP